MRWVRFAVLIVIVTVLQASYTDIVAFKNIKPDLLLILMVFFAIYCNTFDAIITSFAIGFAADIIGPAMGPGIISFGLIGTLLANLRRVITITKMPYQSLAIFACGVLIELLMVFLAFLKKQPTAQNVYSVLFWASLYSAIIGPFLFLPAAWLMRMKIQRFSHTK